MILAIDPGNKESAYALLDDVLKPIEFGKFINEHVRLEIRRLIRTFYAPASPISVAIEMVASYGMPVGAEVFETCVWIGRFVEMSEQCGVIPHLIYRKEEKINLCGSMKAKDGNIRQALIDRFGVVGTKKTPGFFYGFKSDIWQAYAVAITYYDMYLSK